MTKLIRVPDDVYQAIAELASAQHRSITGEAVFLLEAALALEA